MNGVRFACARFNSARRLASNPGRPPSSISRPRRAKTKITSMVLGFNMVHPGQYGSPKRTRKEPSTSSPGRNQALQLYFATHADRKTLRSMVSPSIFRQRSPEAQDCTVEDVDGLPWDETGRSLDVRLVRYKSGEFDVTETPKPTSFPWQRVAVALTSTAVAIALASTVLDSLDVHASLRDAAVSFGLMPQRPPPLSFYFY